MRVKFSEKIRIPNLVNQKHSVEILTFNSNRIESKTFCVIYQTWSRYEIPAHPPHYPKLSPADTLTLHDKLARLPASALE